MQVVMLLMERTPFVTTVIINYKNLGKKGNSDKSEYMIIIIAFVFVFVDGFLSLPALRTSISDNQQLCIHT